MRVQRFAGMNRNWICRRSISSHEPAFCILRRDDIEIIASAPIIRNPTCMTLRNGGEFGDAYLRITGLPSYTIESRPTELKTTTSSTVWTF
jgi:hypothetical protein